MSQQKRFLTQLMKLRFVDKLGRPTSVIMFSWRFQEENIVELAITPSFYMGYMSATDAVGLMDLALLNTEDRKTLDILLE